MTLDRIRKFLVALVGVVGQTVAAGVLSGDGLRIAQIVLAVATAVGVYATPNAKAPRV